jgi:RNA 3'-terminal phosphate cyclase (ATP)
MLEIDGSIGEGGGQVLRTALALSALTGKPMHISNIRASRPKPGLAPQHLTAVRALAEISDAALEGDNLRSTEITFQPQRPPQAGEYAFDVRAGSEGGSAGSVTLILQALLPPLCLARDPSRLTLKGGTHVAWSPPYDYLEHVFLPTIARMGVRASCELEAWGFYPRGGGEIRARIVGLARGMSDAADGGEAGVTVWDACASGLRLEGLQILERGALQQVWGRAVACNLPSHIPQRMSDRARKLLARKGIEARIEPARVRGAGQGAAIFLTAEFQHVRAGFSALGERGKPSEQVAEEAIASFSRYLSVTGAMDPFLADQLLLLMAMASGPSRFTVSEITPHLLTNAAVIRAVTGAEITIEGRLGDPGQVIVPSAGAP